MNGLFRLAVLALLVGLLAPVSVAAPPAPSLRATPGAIYLGFVAQGGTSSRTVSFTNTGKTAITINGWGITGGPFTYAGWSAATCPLVFRRGETGHGPFLMQGQTCTFTVIAQAYNFTDEIYYWPPGTYLGFFYVLGSNDVEIARVPMTVTVVAAS